MGVSLASWLPGRDGSLVVLVVLVVVGLQQKSQLCVQEQHKEGSGRASAVPPGMPVHIDTVGVSTTTSAATPFPLHLLSSPDLLTALLLSHLLPPFSSSWLFYVLLPTVHVLCMCFCDLSCCA